MVEKYWFTTGLSGHGVYKFALRRCDDQHPPPWEVEEPNSPGKKSDSAYSSQSERESSDAGSEQVRVKMENVKGQQGSNLPVVCWPNAS